MAERNKVSFCTSAGWPRSAGQCLHPSAVSGTPFDVTITAVDAYGNIDTNYQGTVILSTTDPDPGVVMVRVMIIALEEKGQSFL